LKKNNNTKMFNPMGDEVTGYRRKPLKYCVNFRKGLTYVWECGNVGRKELKRRRRLSLPKMKASWKEIGENTRNPL
jgi:hypothetical protein